MKSDQRENLIRRYLLGELAEADQTALEQELLIDRGKFDQVWAVENELVDSSVRGDMSRADRERFEGHYLASPLHRERVAIAEAFLADIDQAGGSRNATKAAQALGCGNGENQRGGEGVLGQREGSEGKSPKVETGSQEGAIKGQVGEDQAGHCQGEESSGEKIVNPSRPLLRRRR
jgi:hypothetical protein